MRRWTWILAALGTVAIVIWLLAREDAEPRTDVAGGPPPAPAPGVSAAHAGGKEVSSNAAAAATEDAAPAPEPLDLYAALAARVRGRVVDADGTPRPGIRLALVGSADGSAGSILSAPRILARDGVNSDAAGTFELQARGPTSTFYLCLQRPDGSTQWIQEVSVLPRVTIELGDIVVRAPQRLTGVVRDVAGRPVGGAEVLCADGASFFQAWFGSASAPIAAGLMNHVIPDEAWIQSFVALMPGAVRTQTDARGVYVADVLLADKLQVFVAARAAGMTLETSIPDWELSGELPSTDLTLRPAAERLAGRVRSATGRAIPDGTAVTAHAEATGNGGGYGRAAPVAPDGSFVIDGLLAGPHLLQVHAGGRAPSSEVTADAGDTDVQLELPEPFVLTVQARDMHEAPLARFDVLLSDEPRNLFRTALAWRRIHADPSAGGMLRLDELRSDDVSLQVVANGMAGLPVHLSFGRSDTELTWDETLRPLRTLHGMVRERGTGEPIAGARLVAKMPRGPDFPDPPAFSGADGSFELPPLPVVAFVLRIDAQGFAPQAIDVRTNVVEPVLVELERSTLVHVRIGPRLGDAIRAGTLDVSDDESDVVVTPVPDGKPERFTLRSGGLLLDDLAPGRYRIELLEGAGNMQPVEFTAVAGELVVVDV